MLLSAEASDQGVVRGNNEDRVYSDDARGIYLVVDGMGGHAAGEKAAEIAVERVRDRLERLAGGPEQRVREAIALANNAIFEAAQTRPEWHGMACVLTVAVIEDSLATVGHVGDSRLYKLKPGAIEKITLDHSPVGEREDAGELTEAEAMAHPRRNEVFRDVGSRERTPDEPGFIDVVTVPVEPDSALLLCSDGLTDVVASERVREIVEENASDRFTAVQRLVDAANLGGKDNVSVVLVEGERFAQSFARPAIVSAGEITEPLAARSERPRRSAIRTVLIAAAALTVGALGGMFFEGMRDAGAAPRVLFVAAPARIAEAIDRAKAGDTVQIAPGLYSESIVLKDGVNLAAQTARESRIEGTVSANHVHASVQGLAIFGQPVGIDLVDSSVSIEDCEITGSTEAGVRYQGSSTGRLASSDIRDNAGPGVMIGSDSAPVLEHDAIVGNGRAAGALRPGVWIGPQARPQIVASTFSGNGAEAIWGPVLAAEMAKNNFFVTPGEAASVSFRPIEEPVK